jgi:hypothetical protein
MAGQKARSAVSQSDAPAIHVLFALRHVAPMTVSRARQVWRRAAREIEPRALGVGDAPRAGVVDEHGERAAKLPTQSSCS